MVTAWQNAGGLNPNLFKTAFVLNFDHLDFDVASDFGFSRRQVHFA
jgi:hypothetical protein